MAGRPPTTAACRRTMTPSTAAPFSGRRSLQALVALLALQGVLLLVPVPPWAQGLANYLPLHTALETLAIAVAGMIFATIWSVRSEHLRPGMVVLGCTFLGSALLDFSHMLSYPGMADYITPSSAGKAILFWLTARLLDAAGLLAFATLSLRPGSKPLRPQAVLGATLLLVVLVHAAILGEASWLPRTFVAGEGLTAFKIAAEYAVIALFALAALSLARRMRDGGMANADLFFAAACTAAMSEFFFTHYASTTDIYNLAGHVYKVLACIFLYRAAFSDTVRQPYALLRATTAQQQALLTALPDLLFVVDGEGRYLDIHAGSAGGMLTAAGGLQGKTVRDVMPASEADTVLAAIAEASARGLSRGAIIRLSPTSQTPLAFELSVARAAAENGDAPRYIVISRDVTEREKSAETLRLLSHAVAQSPVSIIVTDLEGYIRYVNDAFVRETGYSAEEAQGRNPSMLQSGKTPAATYQAMWSQLTQDKPWQGELVNRTKSGAETIESVVIYPLRDAGGSTTHYLSHQMNVTAERRAARRIEHLVNYDQLTGLANRRMLKALFTQLCSGSEPCALLWLDLDHFRDINDSLGHSVGDLLLNLVSQRLLNSVGRQDVLSRHSGDEFALLIPQARAEQARLCAQRMLEAIDQPMQLAEHTLSTTASVGIALYPQDGTDFETLLKRAEMAAYEAKDQGRNGWQCFTAELQERSAHTLALSNALKTALANDELHLVYQPQLDMRTGAIIGAETLLRWTHPRWGPVSPAEFIPLAESNGTIVAIGAWVLRTALAQVRKWMEAGLQPLVIAVNLSAVQFGQANLPSLVRRTLEETGVPARYLALELTEATALKAPQAAAQHMRDLRALGTQLAIDDFGTGYSSLSYLKRFKIHKLKIDQSFVRDIHSDADDQAIVVAIIQLARGLGVDTIAEGVETAEQASFLLEHGCSEIQGYHLSRPLPAPEFEEFVRKHAATV